LSTHQTWQMSRASSAHVTQARNRLKRTGHLRVAGFSFPDQHSVGLGS
jgi:predicted aldo/keto reductase-like oxidoreductase